MAEQFREFVDHDDQRWQRFEIRPPRPARRLVLRDSREVARLPQQLLAPGHLAADGVLHAVDEDQLVGEVRDHGRHVRQPLHAEERRAALEIHQHQVQLVRAMRGGQRQHDRFQQLRFAGARRAYAQPVRADAALRGLLEIQVQHLPAGGDADGDAQAIGAEAFPEAQGPRRRGQAQLRQHRVVQRARVDPGAGHELPGESPAQRFRRRGTKCIGGGDVLFPGRSDGAHPTIDHGQGQPRRNGGRRGLAAWIRGHREHRRRPALRALRTQEQIQVLRRAIQVPGIGDDHDQLRLHSVQHVRELRNRRRPQKFRPRLL